MTTQEKLIAALFAAFPGESETQMAKRCGLSIARFSNYKLGKRAMDVDAVIGCAQALGWDVRTTVAQHEVEIAPTPRVKALWRDFGRAATLLAVVVLGGVHGPAQAAGEAGGHSISPITARMHIMSAVGFYWTLLRDWVAQRLQRHKPAADTLEASVCL